MIKTIITAGVLFILPTLAISQQVQQKPVLCDQTVNVLPFLDKTYKEQPHWIGKSSKDSEGWFVVMLNEETKTWTLVQYNREVACILGDGKDFRVPEKSAKKADL
jgi:hypothetical protein